MTSTVLEILKEYLSAEGVRYIFGVPGGLLHPLFQMAHTDPNFDLIVSKHEEGSVFMADGLARTTGKIAVCAATAGPGATNMLTGVAVAFSDNVPLLVITGQAPFEDLGSGAAQETPREDIDIVGMFQPVTKYSTMVSSPRRFGHHLRRALRAATTGRPGPVHLNVPVDFWNRRVEKEMIAPSHYRPNTNLFERESVKIAAEQIAAASFPVILAGAGVYTADAKSELIRLAELANCRVASTPAGKGVFPEDHPLSLGVFGFAGHKSAKEVIFGDEVDMLLCVGTSLNETTTFRWDPRLIPRKSLIQVDIDIDRIGRNYPIDVALVGDARTILTELFFHVTRATTAGDLNSQWRVEAAPLTITGGFTSPGLRASNQEPIAPQRWRSELLDVLPSNSIIFSDVGGHMLFNIHDLVIGADQTFFLNLHFGSMGHGTVAPIGAALGNPTKTVVSIIGDACFTMNGMELIVANEHDIPVIWIVENNQMHGITYHGSKTIGEGLDAVIYKKPVSISAIGRAMGLRASTVKKPGEFESAFLDAVMSRKPSLIEVLVDPKIPPPLEDRSKTSWPDDQRRRGFVLLALRESKRSGFHT